MNAFNKLFTPKTGIPLATNLVAIGAATLYLRSHLIFNHEESEARLDEIGIFPFLSLLNLVEMREKGEGTIIDWRGDKKSCVSIRIITARRTRAG